MSSTGASTGVGEDSIRRHGGYGVTSRHFEPGVWDAARRGEKWRYSFERPSGARDFAFSNATTHRSEPQLRAGERSDFENLPHSVVFVPFAKLAKCFVWTVEYPRRCSQAARSGFDAWGSPQMSRTARPQVATYSVCDNFALTKALAGGRSSSARLNTPCRELSSVSISNDFSVAVRWSPPK